MAEVISLPGMQSKVQKQEPVAEVVHALQHALAEARSGALRSVVIVGITSRPSIYQDRAAITAGDAYALIGALQMAGLQLGARLSAQIESCAEP